LEQCSKTLQIRTGQSVNVYTDRRSELGQTFVEYVLLLTVIALGCLGAVLILSGSIAGLFSDTPNIFKPPSTPPAMTSPSPVAVPTSVQDCLDPGWRNYPQFQDEASCIQFVNGGG
jgi:Flp pilus assembly pilin Flp